MPHNAIRAHSAGFLPLLPAAASALPATRLRDEALRFLHSGGDVCPPDLVCPISQTLMLDPVFTRLGHTYDRRNIRRWFSLNNDTDPATNEPLSTRTLVVNWNARNKLDLFKEAVLALDPKALRYFTPSLSAASHHAVLQMVPASLAGTLASQSSRRLAIGLAPPSSSGSVSSLRQPSSLAPVQRERATYARWREQATRVDSELQQRLRLALREANLHFAMELHWALGRATEGNMPAAQDAVTTFFGERLLHACLEAGDDLASAVSDACGISTSLRGRQHIPQIIKDALTQLADKTAADTLNTWPATKRTLVVALARQLKGSIGAWWGPMRQVARISQLLDSILSARVGPLLTAHTEVLVILARCSSGS